MWFGFVMLLRLVCFVVFSLICVSGFCSGLLVSCWSLLLVGFDLYCLLGLFGLTTLGLVLIIVGVSLDFVVCLLFTVFEFNVVLVDLGCFVCCLLVELLWIEFGCLFDCIVCFGVCLMGSVDSITVLIVCGYKDIYAFILLWC